jgi:hypothetical protein
VGDTVFKLSRYTFLIKCPFIVLPYRVVVADVATSSHTQQGSGVVRLFYSQVKIIGSRAQCLTVSTFHNGPTWRTAARRAQHLAGVGYIALEHGPHGLHGFGLITGFTGYLK